MSSKWFDVDKSGLAKLMAGRPKAFVLFELLQNAWDAEGVSRVDVSVLPLDGTRDVVLSVVDDAPDGFADLRDAFTLFAESQKKGNVQKRGRFNLGEKLVLALAKTAFIESTTGSIQFNANGTRRRFKAGREAGSQFQATLAMTKAEQQEMLAAVQTLIAPASIVTTINGQRLPERLALVNFDCSLPTLLADAEGVLRTITRRTQVCVYEPLPGEIPTLYEMGIPVVETGDRYHVDIDQKVPVNMDRDNVTPSYLRTVRVAVLNAVHDHLTGADSTATWVREACSDERTSPAAVKTAIELRFGANAVRYDPSDPEANKRSQAEGRPVIYGGNLSADEWKNATRAGVLPAAGVVTPSPKPYSPDGEALDVIPMNEWTPGMVQVASFAVAAGRELLVFGVNVSFAREPGWPYAATYGHGQLTFNMSRCGKGFFDNGITEDVIDLIIHEFGHHHCSDHLSEKYYHALTRLGAAMTRLALRKPELFQ